MGEHVRSLDLHSWISIQINPSSLCEAKSVKGTTLGEYLKRYARSTNSVAPSNEADIVRTLHPSSWLTELSDWVSIQAFLKGR